MSQARAPASVLPLLLLVVCSEGGAFAGDARTGLRLGSATVDAEVFIDGERVGRTPLQGVVPISPGEHTIRVARLGFTPYVDVLKVKEGKVLTVEAELIPVAGVLRLSTSLDRVRVFVDDRFIGDAPLVTELEIGAHGVRVTRVGYRDLSFQVNAVAGQVIEKELSLVPLPIAASGSSTPAKWYERWWVWSAGAAAMAVIAVAIIVPTVYYSRGPCDRLGAEICIPVPAVTEPLQVGVATRF